jgi:OPA family glycerol-3-phosphate transporter-like MFS transporter 1/2
VFDILKGCFSSRGLIFGIWNAHTSIGNILGAVIPGAFVGTQW